jgi:hypothetical protein
MSLVAEVDDVFFGHLLADGQQDRNTADTRIENAYGRV